MDWDIWLLVSGKKDSDNSDGNNTYRFAVYMLHDKHKKMILVKGRIP